MMASRGFANIAKVTVAVRWLCEQFQIRDHELIGQLANDIVGIQRAATGQSNA
jgi:hypothetical protein